MSDATRETVGDERDFKSYSKVCATYGAKAAGLLLIPQKWSLPYLSVAGSLHASWRIDGTTLETEYKHQVENFLAEHRNRAEFGFIVRSSGVNELFQDRGRFKSIRIGKLATYNDFSLAAAKIFEHAEQRAPGHTIALILQVYLAPSAAGHLSNEVRLSPTRNQWQYEVSLPVWAAPKGLNSKFAPSPNTQSPMLVRGHVPHAALRSIGKWATDNFSPRVHIEWIVANRQLWIVQLDLEWPELDGGVDPQNTNQFGKTGIPDPTAARIFSRYSLGTETKWKKLRNLSEFDFSEINQPVLYVATGDRIAEALKRSRSELIDEINSLTNARAVVRMDVNSDNVPSFNLPRTDTVSGIEAANWISDKLTEFTPRVNALADMAFIMHAFLPANAGVWAYADPGEPIAYVDALWGLPDGLQVLPHDAYQVDVHKRILLASKIRHKPRFLQETEEGAWKYVDVLRSKSRTSTLSTKDAVEIGVRTAAIAEKLGQRAQIMWFSNIPPEYAVGRNLPWFRARETVDPSPRQQASKDRPFNVRSYDDLKRIPTNRVTLLLEPEAELIRDDHFLDEVIRFASQSGFPVEIHGSTLSHTYYRLFNAGIAVNPPKFGEYSRSRGRQTFGKLVRDKIPSKIKRGGERVSEGLLSARDMPMALLAKLFEEAFEFREARSKEELTEELSDILEIVRSLSNLSEIPWSDVENARTSKEEARGSFLQRRVLLETSYAQPNRREAETSEIALRDLEKPTSETPNSVTFPIAAVISKHADFLVEVNGRRLNITARWDKNGLTVTIDEKPRAGVTELQLELFQPTAR